MTDIVYTTVPGKIAPLFAKIRTVGVPQKATQQWLKTIGFTSSNDGTLLGILKAVTLVDPSGIPTSLWASHRGADHKKVIAEGIRKGYADLFAVYPDAYERTTTELEHVFNTSSSAGREVIRKTVATFRALCECADFGDPAEQPSPSLAVGPMHTPVAAKPAPMPSSSSLSPSVHIDIQIHISPDASPDQIDQIFKSMAKHLYGAKE